MSRMTKHVSKAGKVDPGDRVTLPVKFACKPELTLTPPPRGGGLLPYMGYIGMCRCEGYGFKAVYSGIGYIYRRV